MTFFAPNLGCTPCANLLIFQVPMPTLNSPGHTASREDRPALLAVNDQPGSLFRR